MYMAYNLTKPTATRWYARVTRRPRGDMRAAVSAAETAVMTRMSNAYDAGSKAASEWAGAAAVLAHRSLRGHKFSTTVWTVATLWALMFLSELRLVNQVGLDVLVVGSTSKTECQALQWLLNCNCCTLMRVYHLRLCLGAMLIVALLKYNLCIMSNRRKADDTVCAPLSYHISSCKACVNC